MDDVSANERSVNLVVFSLIAILVGVITGFGAIVFRILISLVHNLTFFGKLSASYDANVYTPASPWGWFVILVPVIGGLWSLIETGFLPGTRGSNRFGPDPLQLL